ncbi:hypothetical protein ACODM8_19575 [Vibrio ostreicida]|uniref:DNA-binding protein n=1 Tax=Vibrio ostreicida TaxID=526588 RepID=A0ABT8BY68_9VIBR|nr:hypothetical protein [Vibrio ostreicida]MDN3611339.1 hypothetical protein [Vibrio ostreicida]NPD09276.1 hypothetical protein [Vibrio ostreicida]
MTNNQALVALMTSRQRLWSPAELCAGLNLDVCDLVRVIKTARQSGVNVCHQSNAQTHYTSKYWLAESGITLG